MTRGRNDDVVYGEDGVGGGALACGGVSVNVRFLGIPVYLRPASILFLLLIFDTRCDQSASVAMTVNQISN